LTLKEREKLAFPKKIIGGRKFDGDHMDWSIERKKMIRRFGSHREERIRVVKPKGL